MPMPLFLFAPGAGAPSSHPWMQRWKMRLQEIGEIETFDYPYMREGRKRPDRLPQLIAAHRAALAEARTNIGRRSSDVLDWQEHGRPDWVSRRARGKGERPDLPRISALCDGRPEQTARRSSAIVRHADSFRTGNARRALSAGSARAGARGDESSEHSARRGGRRPFVKRWKAPAPSGRRNAGRGRLPHLHRDCPVRSNTFGLIAGWQRSLGGYLLAWLRKSKLSTQKNCARVSANCGGFFDLPKLQSRLTELETRMAATDFWSNRERAQGEVEEVSRLRGLINPLGELERAVDDFEALQQLVGGRIRAGGARCGGKGGRGRTRAAGEETGGV